MRTNDERAGLPSGSSALYDSLCHGRYQLQKQWDEAFPEPEVEAAEDAGHDDMDSDAEAGKRIHLLYAGKECPEASQAEIDRAEKARRVDEAMKEQWLGFFDYEPGGQIVEYREKRWWLTDPVGNQLYSGQTDVVWVRRSKDGIADVLVGDLKGLWGHHDPAPINMQLRRYVALVAVNMENLFGVPVELRSASAYLNQPVKTLKPVLTQFEKADIEKAVQEMNDEIAAITDPNAKRTAGSIQCTHCRAKLICEEYQFAEAQIKGVIAYPLLTGVPAKEDLARSIAALPSDKLARILGWVPALIDACDMAKAEAKRRLKADENAVPGWRLWPNSPRSKIDNINTVYERCETQFSLEEKEFTKLCSITKKALTELVREKSGLKGAALELKVGEIIDGAIRTIPVSPSLEKVP